MKTLQAWAEPGVANLVVEAPRGSGTKFKFEEEIQRMILGRPLPAGLVYPCDWGFVAGTEAEDGDPLDAFALWEGHAYPGVVIRARPIGVLRVEQTADATRQTVRNDRVAVVPVTDARLASVRSVLDLAERVRQELEQFFVGSVKFEPKQVSLLGWGGPEEATSAIDNAVRR